MVALFITIGTYLLKVLRFGVKLASTRVGFFLTFFAGAAGTVSVIWSMLDTLGTTFDTAAESISDISSTIQHFVYGNEYLALMSYALSLDFFVDSLVTFFLFAFVTCASLLIGVATSVLTALLPLLTSYLVDALKREQDRIMDTL